jgi:hypothetical protein
MSCTLHEYNRPILEVGNTNSAQGILRLVVTGNVMCLPNRQNKEDNRGCSLWIILTFKFCKSSVHTQLIVSGNVRNFITNTPFCYCSVILFQITVTKVRQRNVSQTQQLLYSRTCNLLSNLSHYPPTHSVVIRLTFQLHCPLPCPLLNVSHVYLSLFHPPVTKGSRKYFESLNIYNVLLCTSRNWCEYISDLGTNQGYR